MVTDAEIQAKGRRLFKRYVWFTLLALLFVVGLFLLLGFASANASAADAHLDYDGWEWHYDDAAPATLTRVVQTGATTEVNIPTNLDGSTPLTAIAASCFNDAEGHKVTKVLSMPATLTNIGNTAFKNCALVTSLIIGNGVTTIDYDAFNGLIALTSVTVPDSVVTLGVRAFSVNTLLATVTLGNHINAIAIETFSYCNHLSVIVIPNSAVSIGSQAFESCYALVNVTIGTGITTISDNAFRTCTALSSITFVGLIAPTSVGNWLSNGVPASVRGHAYAPSTFPAPGNVWNGLTMGTLVGTTASCTTLVIPAGATMASSVAGSTLVVSGAITISATGQLDATNIAWISCGTNWDSSAGTWTPGTNQVNMTGTGTTKLAGGQYFYDLVVETGTTRTLLSGVAIHDHERIDGTQVQGVYWMTITGTNAKPLQINGTTSGLITVSSTAASYTIYTNVAMGTGSISVAKECTFVYSGGQVTITPDSGIANVSMKAWTWASPNYYSLYVGETVGGANVSFVASTLQLNGRYDLYLDGAFDSTWNADGCGDLYFYHATWSGHLLTLRSMLVITSGAPTTTVNEYVPYYYNGTADEAGTWSIVTVHSWMSLNTATGKVTGTPDYSDVAVETVSLRITNLNGTAYLNWTLTVANVVPVWIDVVSNPTPMIPMLDEWSYDFNCSNEGLGVIYSVVCSTGDFSIDSNTGVFSGKPSYDQDVTVTVTADDQNGGLITYDFTIHVGPPDFNLNVLISLCLLVFLLTGVLAAVRSKWG